MMTRAADTGMAIPYTRKALSEAPPGTGFEEMRFKENNLHTHLSAAPSDIEALKKTPNTGPTAWGTKEAGSLGHLKTLPLRPAERFVHPSFDPKRDSSSDPLTGGHSLEPLTSAGSENSAISHMDINLVCEEALRRGKANSAAKCFELPFRRWKLKIRKEDCKVNFTNIRIFTSHGTPLKLPGQTARNKVSKQRNRQQAWVDLIIAVEFTKKKRGLADLKSLLHDFMKVYLIEIDEKAAPPMIFRKMVKLTTTSLPFASRRERVERYRPRPKSYTASRSGSTTPTNASPPMAALQDRHQEGGGLPGSEVVIVDDDVQKNSNNLSAVMPGCRESFVPSLLKRVSTLSGYGGDDELSVEYCGSLAF